MMFNQLIVISWHHNNTEIRFRDQLALSQKDIIQFNKSANIQPHILDFTVLQTCNRMEFYVVTEKLDMIKFWLFKQYHKLLKRNLDFEIYKPSILMAKDAVEHTFRVAAGMESMILGEQQIRDQVQAACNNILLRNKKLSLLKKLFSGAVQCGDTVQDQTRLGTKEDSICLEAVKQAFQLNSHIGNILIIGAGETAELTVRHFIESGAQHLTITNRTEERGRKLADKLNVNYISFNKIMSVIKDMDVIVTATSSMKQIINKEEIKDILSDGNKKRVNFIDISTPRNIDPEIRNISGVTLLDIDSLKNQGLNKSSKFKGEFAKAEKIVQLHVNQFCNILQSQKSPCVITEQHLSTHLEH